MNAPRDGRRVRFGETNPYLSVDGWDEGSRRFSTIREARAAARKFLRENPDEDSVAVIFTVTRRPDP